MIQFIVDLENKMVTMTLDEYFEQPNILVNARRAYQKFLNDKKPKPTIGNN
jgi:hypothetical protein